MSICYLNGEYLPIEEAKVSVMDRGFMFADGVYEVIPVYQGQLFRGQAHIQRLYRSLACLGLEIGLTPEELLACIGQVIEKQAQQNLQIYLQMTRGTQGIRQHQYDQGYQPTVFISASPLNMAPTQPEKPAGVKAITIEDVRWARCDIKSISLLPNILARQAAVERGADEAIFIREGQVTEGAASNIFIVHNGIVKTPPRSPFILGGVTRDIVIELLQEVLKWPFQETQVSEQMLRVADEIWLTSSTKEVRPVVLLDDEPLVSHMVNYGLYTGEAQKQRPAPGPIFFDIHAAYQHFKSKLASG